MAADSDGYIDIRGDGRIVLYKRQHLKNPKWQARISVPNATGYKVVSTKLSDLEEAKRFALNLYEELDMQVKAVRRLLVDYMAALRVRSTPAVTKPSCRLRASSTSPQHAYG